MATETAFQANPASVLNPDELREVEGVLKRTENRRTTMGAMAQFDETGNIARDLAGPNIPPGADGVSLL